MAKLITTKPFSAAERLVKYIEFVANNNGMLPELQIEGRKLNFIVYHNLDIFLPFTILTLLLPFAILKVVRIVLRNFGDKVYLYVLNKVKRE
ncbi:unnamed protein product [Gongylonema pulchrum]|uniref:DUF393 domain-containing protein n=1 Tax=Gongylonema pulchrum TaxID=637853 RepID=A0A183DGH4_9BILA|nr:unnamed protein product [Gongylonema pulchrum]